MIDRRQVLGTAGALAMLGIPAARAATADAGPNDATLARLLDAHVAAFVRRCPEEATALGLDTGAGAALRGRLADRSVAARARDRAAVRQGLAALTAIDPAGLSPRAREDRDVALFVYRTLDDLLGRYGAVDIDLRPSPYVVNQMNGAYYWLPGLIGGGQPLATPADHEAWLARLAALATAIDGDSERLAADAAIGVVPPDFVIDRTIAQLTTLKDTPALASPLIAPAVRRGGSALPAGRAAAILAAKVTPAIARQIAALAALRPRAGSTAGVWHLPDGEAYYAAAVRANTTTDLAPAELHRLGLAQVAELTAALDTALRAQGYAGGSVGSRIAALNSDARFLLPDDDAGRSAIMARLQAVLDDSRHRLPQMFSAFPVAPITVIRMAPGLEAGSPGAFYNGGGADGAGTLTVNLRATADQPTWRLPTLAHHEGIPGHHFQACALAASGALSPFRRLVRFSAYTEGWALYAEQLADEMGCYDDDPVGRIGYLQSMLFRAARIVVDTGIHHKRWTRDEATAWMVANAGESPVPAQREIDRYCVYPGQACSFKVGQNAIVTAREAARQRLGSGFDIRGFHDIVLKGGPMPMAVLADAAARWSA